MATSGGAVCLFHTLQQQMRLFLIASLVVVAMGCRSTVVGPPDIIEPDEIVSFGQSIFPILAQNCALSGCHAGTGTNGVRLGSYAEAVSSKGLQYGERIIQPFNADASPIIDKITNATPEFGERMPFGGPYLEADEIGLIRAWINQGARDN